MLITIRMSCSIIRIEIFSSLRIRQDQLFEFIRLPRIHPGRRFVQEEQEGLGGHRPGDLQAALGAVGQVFRQLVHLVGQADLDEDLVAPLHDLLLFPPGPPVPEDRPQDAGPRPAVAADHHVLQDRHVGEQADVLKGPGHSQLRDLVDLDAVDPPAFPPGRRDEDIPFGRLVDAGDAVEEGGLAGAVGADQGDDLALPDLEVDGVERPEPAEIHRQSVYGQGRSPYHACAGSPSFPLSREPVDPADVRHDPLGPEDHHQDHRRAEQEHPVVAEGPEVFRRQDQEEGPDDHARRSSPSRPGRRWRGSSPTPGR